jgi:hypothetical protein
MDFRKNQRNRGGTKRGHGQKKEQGKKLVTDEPLI